MPVRRYTTSNIMQIKDHYFNKIERMCIYCGISVMDLAFNNTIKCLTENEKIIKDIIE